MKLLNEMLMAENHEDIIEIIETVSSDYKRIDGDKWTLYTHRNTNTLAPMFVAHTDTVSDIKPKEIINDNGVLSNPDGVLGADDRAGCYGLYQMMKNGIVGYFLFTDEEEIGGIGASEFASSDTFAMIKDRVSALIELDRRGSNDVATYCYDNNDLIDLFINRGYKQAMGSYTDVVSLASESDIACVNLSIGYYNEHTSNEKLVISELNRTIDMLLDDMPMELYEQKYEVDFTCLEDNYFEVDEYSYKVLCDGCKLHSPLYEFFGQYLCEDCLKDIKDDIY